MGKSISEKIKIMSFVNMILVVFIHAYNLEEANVLNYNCFIQKFISNGVARTAVPYFFIFSGYLFFLNLQPTVSGFLKKYKSRFFSLFIPFVLWTMISTIFVFILQNFPQFQSYFSGRLLKEYTIIDFAKLVFVNQVYAYQLWFIRDLMVFIVATPIIYFLLKKASLIALVSLGVGWIIGIQIPIISISALFFFFIGASIGIKQIDLSKIKISIKYKIIFTIIWIILLILNTLYNNNFILDASIIFGVASSWYLYDWVINKIKYSTKKLLLNFSAYSFFLYLLHEPYLEMIKKLFLKFFGLSNISRLFVYFSSAIIIITICLLTGFLLNKYLSNIYGILVGGRTSKRKLPADM